MDLGTVKKKLINNKYDIVEAVLDDVQLIWDNCKTYNQVDSVF
jgi:histone acetyltransferase